MGNNFSKEQQDENDQGERIIQQIIDFHTKIVNEAGITKDYETILSELKIAKYLLENIPAEDGLNLYQALVLDTILHCNYDVTSQISGNEIVTNNTIELFKVLIEIVKNYLTLFGEIELNKLPTRNYKTYKQSLEISYNSLAFFKRIRDAEHLKELEEIFNDLEQKKFLLEEKEDGNTGLTFYQKLILELLEKGTKLNQDIQEDNFIEWVSSKFEKYANLFEHIPRDQLPFDYKNSQYFFKFRSELILLTNRLEAVQMIEEIDEILSSLEEIKPKSNIEELNNELFYNYVLLLNASLYKAINIYNETSENLTLDKSVELLKKLLDNFQITKISSILSSLDQELDGAISEYHDLRGLVTKNYFFLQITKILSSDNPDISSIESLSEEIKDISEMKIDEDGLHYIIGLYKVGTIENIDDLERVLSYMDACKPILDKYATDKGLSVYPILLVHAISRFINIGTEDVSLNNRFSKQLEKYTKFFQSLDTELFPTDMKPFFNELKNSGAIVSINESILDKLMEQFTSSERVVNEEIIYNGEVDLTILSDQIAIFRELIVLYDSFSPDIKEAFNNSLKRILIISAGSFEQVLANKHHEALNAVIKILFFINNHIQENPIVAFDSHFAMKICGHLTHRLYYLREGDNENTISTGIWLILAKDVLNAIERNGIENYRTVINYEGDLYRNLKAIYTIQPPRENYISDDLNSIAHQLNQKVSEIITLKGEFTVGASAPLEERQRNIPLRALACMVKSDQSHLNNVENILIQLTGEYQLNSLKMAINALMMANAWDRIINILENKNLNHLKDEREIFFPYICAKINRGHAITADEIKYYEETISDLERIFLAEVFINIGDYKQALFQIDKITLDALDHNSLKYTVLIIDRFCYNFLYSRDNPDSGLLNKDMLLKIESIYSKFVEIELPSYNLKSQIQYRLLKLYLYSNNNEKINDLISILSESKEVFREYKDAITNSGKLNEEQQSNLATLIGTCKHELTIEETINTRKVFQELADAAIENDQIIRDKNNEIALVNEISIEQKLDTIYQQTPVKKAKTFSKPIFKEIEKAISDLEPKNLVNLKSSIVQTDHYHIDVALMPGTTNIFKIEIQGKNKGGIDNQTVAQVIYDPLMLLNDLEKIGSQIILLLNKAASLANKAENGRYYCQEYDLSQTNQFEILHRGSSLQLQKNSLDYMFDYNELALKNLLEIRLKSAIEEDDISKNIKVLEAEIVDIHYNSISTQTKIISMSDSIINIYNADKTTKHILIPILIPKNIFVYHWVGVAITKEENKLSIAYLDSENYKDIVPLQTILTYNLQKLFPHLYVSFTQISLEQQKYNNCGLELIENFIFYLTSTRVSQEEAPYLHNDLWLQKLIFDQIKLDRGFAEVPLISYSSVQSINSLLDKKINAQNIPYQLARSAAAYINEVAEQIDLNWEFKKWLYLKDIAKFDQIMQKYNIARSVDELKDLEPSFYSFSIDLEDKELERDVLFVANLKEKLNLPAGTKEIEYLKPFIYKLNIAIKITDTAVDLTRLFYIPTIENTQKTLMDVANIYSMHAGINGLSLIPIGYEAINKYLQLGLVKTLIHVGPQLVKTLGHMILPTIIASFGISYIGFSYSVGLTIYGGFNAIDNMKSLYNEFYQKDFNLNSNIAYQNIAEKLSNTCLQNLYDFASKAKDYEKAAYKIKLEEKGEFGKKLYEYIYSRVIDEKYDLQNNSKSKQIKIMDYDYCIKIIEFKEEESDHYYCYNEEQEILDHIVIIGEAYIQKSVSL